MRPRDLIARLTPGRLAVILLLGAAGAGVGAAPAAASVTTCTVTWTGSAGDGLWSDAGNWSTGAVPAGADDVCLGAGPGVPGSVTTAAADPVVTLDSTASVAALELDGATLDSSGSPALTVSNELNLENAGAGIPDAFGAGITITTEGTTTVDSGLDVCLAAGDTLANSGTLTLGDGADIGGDGVGACAGTSGGSVTSTGTIASQATGTQATIDALSSATGSTLSGPGTLTVGSSLTFPAGGGGEVDLSGQLTLQDGAATSIGAGVQVCEDPSATLTIESSAAVTLGQYADLGAGDQSTCENGTGGGQVTNEGTITATATATIAPAFFDNDGAVELTGASGSALLIPASSSTAGEDTGTYAVGAGTTLNLGGTSRTIAYGGTNPSGTFSGAGTLFISSGTTYFESDADLASLGHFQVSAGATAEVDYTLETPASGTASTTVYGDIDGYGTATVATGSVLTLTGPDAQIGEALWLINDGSASVTGSAKACVDQDATLENAGTLVLGSSSNLGVSATNTNCDASGSLLNDVGATITSAGSATIDTATFDNAGTVAVTGGTLALTASNQSTDTGSYAVSGPATLSIQGSATRVLQGQLSGAGRLTLAGARTSLAVMPGASGSIGTLTVGAGTTLQLDGGPTTPLAPAAPALSAGLATLNGTVQFNGDAVTVTSAETLDLLGYTSRSGSPATPADDNGWSATVPSGTGTGTIVANVTPAPPQNTTVPQITGNAAQGATLTVTQGSWTGSPTQISDQWEDCDTFGDPCTPIAGATGSTYTPTQNDVGNQIEVAETATNAGGSTTADTETTGVVSTLAPTNLSAPAINGDQGEVGEVLTEVPGAWENSPSVSLQWEDCDITGMVCTPIAAATRATYTTTENDSGDSIVVVETATNAYGSSQAASEPTDPLIDLSDGGYGGGGGNDGSGYDTGSGSGGGRSSGTASVSVPVGTISGSDLAIGLRCRGKSSCPVILTLKATESTDSSRAHAASRGRKARHRVVVVGSQTVTIGSGDHRTVTVALNRTGTKLLDSAHSLRTVLTASSRSRTLETRSVTFTLAKSHASGTPASKGKKTSRGHRASAHRATKPTRHSSAGSPSSTRR
jgi:fibronectin-binding autotransporter adhesin